MASNFRHPAGCEDFLLLRKLRRQPDRALAAERPTHAGRDRCGLTHRRSTLSVKKRLSFICLLMFLSLLEEITGQGLPVECSKLTCSAKVKKSAWYPAVRPTIEVGRCQSLFAYCAAEFDLGKGKIGRRRHIHIERRGQYPSLTHESVFTRVRVGESKVKSTFGGPQPINNVCVDSVPVYMVALCTLS